MAQAAPFSINRRISSTRHAVVRGPNLTGFGKRPSLMPAHQVDFDTGIGPRGANIDARRTKPVSGSVACCAKVRLHPIQDEGICGRPKLSRANSRRFVANSPRYAMLRQLSFAAASDPARR